MPPGRFCASITGSGSTTNPTSSRAVATDISGHITKRAAEVWRKRGWLMRASYLFTSESVSEGHPDKVCDRISDEIVDLFFREGPKAGIDPWAIRTACETLATTNKVVIAGETRGPKSVTNDQIVSVVREAIKDIGYEQEGFHWNTCDIEILLHPQSADIAQGVDALQPGTAAGGRCWARTPRARSPRHTLTARPSACAGSWFRVRLWPRPCPPAGS